jgi:hypothetical protein
MRVLSRSGPLLLALGITLTGCGPSGDVPSKGPSQASPTAGYSQGDSGTKVAKADQSPTGNSSDSQVVLGIQGMT